MKQTWVAYLLLLFLGALGVHKFYLGRIGAGIFYLFTLGGFGIGLIFDLFTLGQQVKTYNAHQAMMENAMMQNSMMKNAMNN